MRIAIVDDHQIVREGIRWMLASDEEVEIVGEAGSGTELLDLLNTSEVDAILLDVRMPDMSGIDVLEKVRDTHPGVRVIMLTMHDQPAYVRRAIELGAHGYLLKSSGREELLRAIAAAMAGDMYVHGSVITPLVAGTDAAGGRATLSPRELQIVQLIADGYENKQIASELQISEATVKTYLRDAFERLGATSRAQAVAIALREDLID